MKKLTLFFGCLFLFASCSEISRLAILSTDIEQGPIEEIVVPQAIPAELFEPAYSDFAEGTVSLVDPSSFRVLPFFFASNPPAWDLNISGFGDYYKYLQASIKPFANIYSSSLNKYTGSLSEDGSNMTITFLSGKRTFYNKSMVRSGGKDVYLFKEVNPDTLREGTLALVTINPVTDSISSIYRLFPELDVTPQWAKDRIAKSVIRFSYPVSSGMVHFIIINTDPNATDDTDYAENLEFDTSTASGPFVDVTTLPLKTPTAFVDFFDTAERNSTQEIFVGGEMFTRAVYDNRLVSSMTNLLFKNYADLQPRVRAYIWAGAPTRTNPFFSSGIFSSEYRAFGGRAGFYTVDQKDELYLLSEIDINLRTQGTLAMVATINDSSDLLPLSSSIRDSFPSFYTSLPTAVKSRLDGDFSTYYIRVRAGSSYFHAIMFNIN
ncbi:MAG: hypothetical protein ACRC9L_06540 [Brevinema sp.]